MKVFYVIKFCESNMFYTGNCHDDFDENCSEMYISEAMKFDTKQEAINHCKENMSEYVYVTIEEIYVRGSE